MTRKEELEALDWQEIKEIAEEYGIKKPPTGWKDAVTEILEFEEIMDLKPEQKPELPLLAQPEIKPIPETKLEPAKPAENPKLFVFATEYYKAVGIPYCPKCGAAKQTVDGEQVCAISDKDCEWIK